jgi:hypothetical protein
MLSAVASHQHYGSTTTAAPHTCTSGPVPIGGRAARYCVTYRYWPVFDAVSIARPVSAFLPVTRVRM